MLSSPPPLLTHIPSVHFLPANITISRDTSSYLTQSLPSFPLRHVLIICNVPEPLGRAAGGHVGVKQPDNRRRQGPAEGTGGGGRCGGFDNGAGGGREGDRNGSSRRPSQHPSGSLTADPPVQSLTGLHESPLVFLKVHLQLIVQKAERVNPSRMFTHI